MSPQNSNPGGDDLDPSDRAWLEALRGGAMPEAGTLPADAHSAALGLGAAYRESALRTAPPSAEPDPAQRQARLLAQARTAGLLAAPAARWRWLKALSLPSGYWRLQAPGFALALVGVVVSALWLGAPETPEDTVLRGPSATPPTVVADPNAVRDAAVAALQAAGIEAAPFDTPGGFGLEVEVPAAPSPAARAALQGVFGNVPQRGSQQRVYLAGPPVPASPDSATKPAQ